MEKAERNRIEVKALVIGYAMSRLDSRYLILRGLNQWQEAFREAGNNLEIPSASFKNLRDEFDPIHANSRLGWHNRRTRPNRLRAVEEMQEVSDDALMKMVARILQKDDDAISEAVDVLADQTRIPYNVAERLLTGRKAEEYFLAYSSRLVHIEFSKLLDCRQDACGFDFGVSGNADLAFEIKGLKSMRGGIQFTDKEWREAKHRRDSYHLVVVGNLISEPIARVFPDPYGSLAISCVLQSSVTAIWRSMVSVSA